MNELIDQLNQWLSKEGNTKTKLAAALDYNSTATIDYWLSTGRVPPYQITNLRRLLDGKKARQGASSKEK